MNIQDKESDAIIRDIYIAAPCNVGWENMTGDDKVRACGLCQKNVYNTSKLTKQELATLIVENEGKVCLRLYRRKDGTVMTENCPVGLRRIRDGIKWCAIMALLALAWLGLISEAHAQGLIGAPIDGGVYRGSPSPEYCEYVEHVNRMKIAQIGVSTVAIAGAVIWLLKRVKRHRNSLLLIATALGLLFATIGFLHGMLEPIPDYIGYFS